MVVARSVQQWASSTANFGKMYYVAETNSQIGLVVNLKHHLSICFFLNRKQMFIPSEMDMQK